MQRVCHHCGHNVQELDAEWLCNTGKEGGGPKEGMSGALDDTKKAASDAAAGQSL